MRIRCTKRWIETAARITRLARHDRHENGLRHGSLVKRRVYRKRQGAALNGRELVPSCRELAAQ